MGVVGVPRPYCASPEHLSGDGTPCQGRGEGYIPHCVGPNVTISVGLVLRVHLKPETPKLLASLSGKEASFVFMDKLQIRTPL